MGWRLRRRRAARVVLLDPDDRVLLLYHERSAPGATGGWYLPGGGILPWESIEAAAQRELREETGIAAVIGPVLGQREGVRFVFRGRVVEQDEWYLAGRTASPRVGEGRRGDGERRAIEGHRWWTAAELASTGETLSPPGFADLVAAAMAWNHRMPADRSQSQR
jgi:8-oxo-dGTP pyrophosphatase MutT (NUDIX family)